MKNKARTSQQMKGRELEAYCRSASTVRIYIRDVDREWATENGAALSALVRGGGWAKREDGGSCIEGVVDALPVRLCWDGRVFGLEVRT